MTDTDIDPNMTPIGEEQPYDPKLSSVSQAYDRGQKGYLDTTEKKLRAMDTENKGELDLNRMYELMRTMESEQKKAVSLKRAVIALCCFAVLLALANIGTSFAAATLAKETTTSSNGDLLIIGTTDRVAVTPRVPNFGLTELTPGERLLQYDLIGNGGSGTRSPLTLLKTDADKIFQQICGKWGGMDTFPCGQSYTCITAGTATMTGCTEGYMTALTYKVFPTCSSDENYLKFTYSACRGTYCYGDVTFTCDKRVDSNAACTVTNMPCEKVCDICSTSGGSISWWCNSAGYCGCTPNSCVTGTEDQTCYDCYNGAGDRTGC